MRVEGIRLLGGDVQDFLFLGLGRWRRDQGEEREGKGDRKTSDYYVVKLEEAKYPGKAIKVISASPP